MKVDINRVLAYDVKDKEGWPVGISEASKSWAIDLIRAALAGRGEAGLTLLEVRQALFDDPVPDRPVAFWIARMDLWELAVSYKVLMAVGTKPIWMLGELRKEVGDYDD